METSDENLSGIKKDYEDFKKSIQYEERKKQLLFSDFAKSIIEKVILKKSITNDDLTALIQIFGYGSKHDNIKKYIYSLELDDAFTKEIFDKLVKSGQTGFTGIGKSAIKGLTSDQLQIVHTFLKNVLNSDSKEQIKKLVSDYEKSSIPQVTSGIYSPWLYYLHPTICPIVVGPVKQYLMKIGWDQKHYIDAWDMLEQINQEINETNYGFFDAFIYEKSLSIDSNYWLFIVPKEYESGELWEYCKQNSIAAMQYEYESENASAVTRNLNQIKKIELGDKVIVYQRNKIVGGIGTVTKTFYEDTSVENGFDGMFGQRIGLEWIDDYFEKSIESIWSQLSLSKKNLALKTIHNISESDYRKISSLLLGKVGASFIEEYEIVPQDPNISLLNKKKQIILYGPPGTGKTYSTKKMAVFCILAEEE